MKTRSTCPDRAADTVPTWLPPGAIDSHVHVIDSDAFPYSADKGYKPTTAEGGNAAALATVIRSFGISGALLVQPSCYGTDNRALLAALATRRDRYRGIAVVSPCIESEALQQLSQEGVVGVRLNVVNMGNETLHEAGQLLRHLSRFGMVAEVQCPARQLSVSKNGLLDSGACILLDHLGYPDAAAGPGDAAFREVCELSRCGRVYVKLSGAFRLSGEPWPHADIAPFAKEILQAFGAERCVWGSDWPFVGVSQRPSYLETLSILERWVASPEALRQILVETPRALFRFPNWPA